MPLEQKIAPRPLDAKVACARTKHPLHKEPDHSDDSGIGVVGESTFQSEASKPPQVRWHRTAFFPQLSAVKT